MIEKLICLDWAVIIPVSIITSFIFLLFIALIRPIVSISNIILHSEITDKITGNPKKVYKIKVVNWTMANIYEVKIELYLATLYGDGHGTSSVRYHEIPMIYNNFMYLPSMIWSEGREHAEYAQIFMTDQDVEALWKNESQYLEFRMVAKHGLSGFNKVITKRFTDKAVIKEGKYIYGTSRKCKNS